MIALNRGDPLNECSYYTSLSVLLEPVLRQWNVVHLADKLLPFSSAVMKISEAQLLHF